MPPLLLLFILPSVSFSFLFGNQCNQCQQQPSYQQSYYPQSQPQYYPQQPQYSPQPQQGYVLPPRPHPTYHTTSPIYRNPLRQHSIPESAYGSPPGFKPTITRPSLSRSGYGNNEFLGEGSISVRPSAEGERATYIMNRHGANSLVVHGDESIRTLAPPPSISQPMVDEVVVEANAPARQSVQVLSESQPIHPVEKLYRPTVHEETVYQPSVDPTPTYTAPTPSYTPSPVYEPHVVEATSEFRGVEPSAPAPSYPIEQQGYDSASEAPITPYEPATYSPPVQVQPSTGYDGVKRFAGFGSLRASGLARRAV